jgi:GxxExxY protein
MVQLLHSELTYYLRGLGFRIHNALHGGHEEKDYESAVVWSLVRDNIPFRQQPRYQVDYKGQQIGEYYPDLTVADKLLVDFKVAPSIEPLHKAQGIAYLAVTQLELALIMNFGAKSMQFERLPNFTKDRKREAWRVSLPSDILYPELTNQLLDVLHEVHFLVGPGFLSQIYRRATRIELALRQLPFDYLKQLPLTFEGNQIKLIETRLFYIEQRVLLATIALSSITPRHTEKMRWAMRQTNCKLGLIANFYPSRLECRFLRIG